MALDCSEMVPGRLWVGAFVRPDAGQDLIAKGITAVLSLQSDEDLAYYGLSVRRLSRSFALAGLAYERMPVEDFSSDRLALKMPECVASLVKALSPENARVYLHCTAGINRAPTVAAGYLILEHGMPARVAYDYVRERRECSPYLKVLEGFEDYLRKRGSDARSSPLPS
jgi:protein-tyrosine phosphatase